MSSSNAQHRSASPHERSSGRHRSSRHSHSDRHRHRGSSRSRSPHRSKRPDSGRHRHHDRERDRHESKRVAVPEKPVVLPLNARELSRRDLEVFEPMFAMYLDIQKGKYIDELSEEEVKGRWKSFIRKWNRAELAEGWYDPTTLEKARNNADYQPGEKHHERASPDYGNKQSEPQSVQTTADDEDDEDDEYGPTLPQGSARVVHSGPTIPNIQELQLKRESTIKDATDMRQESREQYRNEIQSHKTAMRNLQDEIAPRAEPGSRERQLEKRREAAASNRSFAAARGGSPEAAPEEQLMGSGDNDLAALKREKELDQRKKNDREIRREEILRARAAEREERIQKYQEKEQETMGWLKTLAKERFG